MKKGNGFFEMILGIEGGGTKTTWALLDPRGKVRVEGITTAGNTQHLNDRQLRDLFQEIKRQGAVNPDAIGGAFAGCHLETERQRIREALKKAWPSARKIVVGEDTLSAFAGAHGDAEGIIVIAGTGSNVMGKKGGRSRKAGGYGHLFADPGSGYDLARRGLEAVYSYYDATGKTTPLGRIFLRHSGQNTLEELVPWALERGSKTEVAALAPLVFEAAEAGDMLARGVIRKGAENLAECVKHVARHLGLKAPGVGCVGSLLRKNRSYFQTFAREVRRRVPGARVFVSQVPGEVGAAKMAAAIPEAVSSRPAPQKDLLHEMQRATTEQRNPRSRGLDKKSVAALVDLFISEERRVESALRSERKNIAKVCALAADKIRAGGRVFYVGAGTSGRLGVVDASEMPPTFGVGPELFQAIIAGGSQAVFRSQEGAEDDAAAGAEALEQRGVTGRDLVIGIAASGRTPFVLGALNGAVRKKITAALISCNPRRPAVKGLAAAVDLPAGPELVTGSTRLKAGTATKLVLNMISTVAMIRNGRVKDNLMISVQATNEKLRDRAVRMVMELCRCDAEEARRRLSNSRWDVGRAVSP
jgi:N-acetylmuramic acid 6-phosphate etherase